jgi:hypothetical protein
VYQTADADVAESLFAMLIAEAKTVVVGADREKLPKRGRGEEEWKTMKFSGRIIKYDKRH